VTILDAASQDSTTTTFESGSWNNGDPSLGIGESAFFNLLPLNDPPPVPEPAAASMLGLGAVLLLLLRRRDVAVRGISRS
jgi:hypothetical protein